VIKLLGRQTSGNVQKVLFLLEELHIPYTREDYGRAVRQHPDRRLPCASIPTPRCRP